MKAAGEEQMRAAFALRDKQERTTAVSAARDAIKEALTEEQLEDANLGSALKKLEAGILRGDVVKTGTRIDGRKTDEVRDIVCETGMLPRTHGSALFTRGETQGLVVTTLGTGDDEQIIDALHGNFRSNFLLHYNFPPYSVGEVGRVGSPGRREIGHGKLAWRALQAVLPAATDFPYTVRRGVRDHRIQRLLFHGVRLWWLPVHDGRRCATEIRRCRCGHGPHPGRQR